MALFAHGDGVLKQQLLRQENTVCSVSLMDHHCSGPLRTGDARSSICIMVYNDTFIADYSYLVGLICSPTQHLHDSAEAAKVAEAHGVPWRSGVEAVCCPGVLGATLDASLKAQEVSPTRTSALSQTQPVPGAAALLLRGGNLGDGAPESGCVE